MEAVKQNKQQPKPNTWSASARVLILLFILLGQSGCFSALNCVASDVPLIRIVPRPAVGVTNITQVRKSGDTLHVEFVGRKGDCGERECHTAIDLDDTKTREFELEPNEGKLSRWTVSRSEQVPITNIAGKSEIDDYRATLLGTKSTEQIKVYSLPDALVVALYRKDDQSLDRSFVIRKWYDIPEETHIIPLPVTLALDVVTAPVQIVVVTGAITVSGLVNMLIPD
jgi:hypothetical protein